MSLSINFNMLFRTEDQISYFFFLRQTPTSQQHNNTTTHEGTVMKVIVAVVVLLLFALELATPVSAANNWTTYTSSLNAAKEVGNEPSNETATAQVRDYPSRFFFLCLIFYSSHLSYLSRSSGMI